MASSVKPEKSLDQTLTSKKFYAEVPSIKNFQRALNVLLYLVVRCSQNQLRAHYHEASDSFAHPPPQKKIKKIKPPLKNTCPESKIQKNPSIFPVTSNPEYPPPPSRFSKAERFLKSFVLSLQRCLFPRVPNSLRLDSKIWKLVNSFGVVKQF